MEDLRRALEDLLEHVVEDIPHESRGKHLQMAIDDAFAVLEENKTG